MGIRDRPTSFRAPWQNGYVERLIGSIRRECTDHLIVVNAEHRRRILAKYATYYNEARTHVSLGKDAPYTSDRAVRRYCCASHSWRAPPSITHEFEFSEATGAAAGCRSLSRPRCTACDRVSIEALVRVPIANVIRAGEGRRIG